MGIEMNVKCPKCRLLFKTKDNTLWASCPSCQTTFPLSEKPAPSSIRFAAAVSFTLPFICISIMIFGLLSVDLHRRTPPEYTLWALFPIPLSLLLAIYTKIRVGSLIKRGFSGLKYVSWLAQWGFIFSMFHFISFVFLPNFYHFRSQSNAGKAEETGYYAREAELKFYMKNKIYTSDLNRLLKVDKYLIDDQNVTFSFLHSSISGFTFYTVHSYDEKSRRYSFHD